MRDIQQRNETQKERRGRSIQIKNFRGEDAGETRINELLFS